MRKKNKTGHKVQ